MSNTKKFNIAIYSNIEKMDDTIAQKLFCIFGAPILFSPTAEKIIQSSVRKGISDLKIWKLGHTYLWKLGMHLSLTASILQIPSSYFKQNKVTGVVLRKILRGGGGLKADA